MMKRVSLITVLLAGVMLTGCGQNNTDVKAAMSAIEALNYDDAKEYLDAAETDNENERLIARARGIIALGSADYDAAKDYFTKALQTGDGSVSDFEYDVSYYLAAAEYKSGDYEGAEKTYSAIIGMQPKDSNAYYLRGTTNLALNKHDEALRDFNSAIDGVKDPDLYIKIYEVLEAAGYKEEGADYLDRAQNLDVKLSDYQKGRLYFCSENYEDARTFLEKARLSGDEGSVLYLGRTYEALGDLNYAASLYKTYLEKNPGDSQICNQLGLCMLDNGDYEGALKAFESGLNSDDGSSRQTLRFNEIVAYERMSDFKKAAVLMQAYLTDYPDDAQAAKEYEFLKTR